MALDASTGKFSIPALGLKVSYQDWSTLVESALMTKGLLSFIKTPLPVPHAAIPPTPQQLEKRTQAFGFIMLYLDFSERQAVAPIIALNTQDAHALWADIKQRHEMVTTSRIYALWRRLNAAPDSTMSDVAGINAWFSGCIAAYTALKASGRQLDEYIACLIMLGNLPAMWDSMRRSITQAGNDNISMTFAVLRNNMESELITHQVSEQHGGVSGDDSQALVTVGMLNRFHKERQQQDRRKAAKRQRIIFQRTPGATCTKCKKRNHTAQQCGKAVDNAEQKESDDGAAQLTSSTGGQPPPRSALFDADSYDDYGQGEEEEEELNMTTACDDSSALAATKSVGQHTQPCNLALDRGLRRVASLLQRRQSAQQHPLLQRQRQARQRPASARHR